MVENHNMVNPYRCVFVPCLSLNSEIEDSFSCSSSSFVLEILLAPKLPSGTGCDSEPTAKQRQDDDEIAERKDALNVPSRKPLKTLRKYSQKRNVNPSETTGRHDGSAPNRHSEKPADHFAFDPNASD